MATSFRDMARRKHKSSPKWNRFSGLFRVNSTSSTISDSSLQLNPTQNSRFHDIKPSYMSDYDTSSFGDGSSSARVFTSEICWLSQMAEDDHHHEEEIEQLKEVEHKESLMEKISEKLHGHDSLSDSDDSEKAASVKSKIFRLFGREKPVHQVFGGGKPAEIFLWRNKKVSGGVLGGVTAIYVLFELIEYHLLTLLCHSLILVLAVLFLWSNASSFINKSPPSIPKVHIPEDTIKEVASAVRSEINHGLAILRDIASGKDVKSFLIVMAGLWILSILGSCCKFLSLFYSTMKHGYFTRPPYPVPNTYPIWVHDGYSSDSYPCRTHMSGYHSLVGVNSIRPGQGRTHVGGMLGLCPICFCSIFLFFKISSVFLEFFHRVPKYF